MEKIQLKLWINTLICWNKNQTWMIVGVCYDFNCAIVPLVPWFDDLPNIWVLPNSWCNKSWTCYQHKHTHTHNCLMALYPGLPWWASTWRNIHPLTPMRKKKQALLWASEGCYKDDWNLCSTAVLFFIYLYLFILLIKYNLQ